MPTPNGDSIPAFDPAVPADLDEISGFVLSMHGDLAIMKAEQARQGRLVDKIALALGIKPDRSDPPPDFRAKLDSQEVELARLQKVDAETSQSIKAVTDDIAATKVILRVGLIEGVPKLAKVVAGLTAAIVALTLLGSQIWAALR